MAPGVVIVTHYRLGEEFLQALRRIVPDAPPFQAVSIDPKQSVDEMREAIADALRRAGGEGVLILTDMFGGTPSNLAISVMDDAQIEVIAGINLPMLVKLASVRQDCSLTQAIDKAKDAGRKYISVASQVLAGHQ